MICFLHLSFLIVKPTEGRMPSVRMRAVCRSFEWQPQWRRIRSAKLRTRISFFGLSWESKPFFERSRYHVCLKIHTFLFLYCSVTSLFCIPLFLCPVYRASFVCRQKCVSSAVMKSLNPNRVITLLFSRAHPACNNGAASFRSVWLPSCRVEHYNTAWFFSALYYTLHFSLCVILFISQNTWLKMFTLCGFW